MLNPNLPLGIESGDSDSAGTTGALQWQPSGTVWCGPIATTLRPGSALPGSRFRIPLCAADTASTTTRARIRASRSNWPCSPRLPQRRPIFRRAAGESHAAKRISAAATGITNNYAVNPNYRLGYVQIRNLDIQQQIRPTLLLNLDYTGTKGTDLDILEAPNRTPTGIRIPALTRSPTRIRLAIRRPMRDRCACASGCQADLRLAASTPFRSRSMMLLRLARGRPRWRVLPGLGAGGTGALGGAGLVNQRRVAPMSRRILSISPRSAGFRVLTRLISLRRIIWRTAVWQRQAMAEWETAMARDFRRLAMERRLDDRVRTSVHAAICERSQRREHGNQWHTAAGSSFPGNGERAASVDSTVV